MNEPAYDKDRTLKLVRSQKLLKKLWDKVPRHQDKDQALQSLFNAMIKGDRGMMDLYKETV